MIFSPTLLSLTVLGYKGQCLRAVCNQNQCGWCGNWITCLPHIRHGV